MTPVIYELLKYFKNLNVYYFYCTPVHIVRFWLLPFEKPGNDYNTTSLIYKIIKYEKGIDMLNNVSWKIPEIDTYN